MKSGDLWVSMVPVPKGNQQKIIRFGNFVRVRPLDRIVEAQAELADGLKLAAPGVETLAGPVWRDACYVLPIPKSWPKWKQAAALELRFLPPGGGRQADTGNLTKLLDDALEAAGLIENDGQIVGGTTCKLYGTEPGYVVRLTELPQATRSQPAWPFVRPPLIPPTGYESFVESSEEVAAAESSDELATAS